MYSLKKDLYSPSVYNRVPLRPVLGGSVILLQGDNDLRGHVLPLQHY